MAITLLIACAMSLDFAESAISRQHSMLIGSDALLAAWKKCCPSADDVTPVPSGDVAAALDVIRREQPAVVILEETFAGSTGAPLVTQLQTGAEFEGIEIRLLAADRVAALQSAHAGDARTRGNVVAFARAVALRRDERFRPATAVDVLVNGDRAALLDLSVSGIQVRSRATLRPHQRVSVSLPLQGGAIKKNGTVVWAAFEMRLTPMYRAGVRLSERLALTSEEILSRLVRSKGDGPAESSGSEAH